MERRLYNIFKSKNATKLSKPIIESHYKVLSDKILFNTIKRLVLSLWTVELLTTFKLWQYHEKSCETTFWVSLDKSLKTRQDSFSCDHPVENSGFLKNWKNYDFWWLFLKNIKMSKSWITHNCKYDQSCFNFKNFAYSKSPLLKVRTVELAVSFQRLLHGSPE